MPNRCLLLVLFVLLFAVVSSAQDSSAIQKYIAAYKDLAIQEMQRTGVPASIKLAQGIHETLAGTSDLVKKSNNHFGIKCKDTWTGASVRHTDDRKNECFRKYNSAEDSYRDHSDFLRNSTRYSFLFELDPTDYAGWAYGLKKAGYATNPKYSQLLIKLIEDYNLQEYTLIALGKTPAADIKFSKTNAPAVIPDQPAVASSTSVNKEETKNQTAASQKDGLLNLNITNKEPVLSSKQNSLPSTREVQTAYPAGVFKINDTKVIFSRQGTPFLAIAQQYNIALNLLFEFNDLKETEQLDKDQLIFLQRKRKTGNNEFHTVQYGETLYDIAQNEAIRLESLLELNRLSGDAQPAVGETLYLRTKAPAMPRLALKENYTLNPDMSELMNNPGSVNNIKKQERQSLSAKYITYTVKPKDNLWTISQKYKVKIDDLVKWNDLPGKELKRGQQLKIYK
jgi:LysM repeat protein